MRVMSALLFATLAAAATTLTRYPVVAHVHGVPVEAPASQGSWGACPSGTLPITNHELAVAKQAVRAAMPAIARQTDPPLNLTHATVTIRRTRSEGDILPSRRACWGTPFARSVLAQVFLPAERSAPALRGNPWYYVARTQRAWVIWDEPH